MSQITSEEHSLIQTEIYSQRVATLSYPGKAIAKYDNSKGRINEVDFATSSSKGSCKMTTCLPIATLQQLNQCANERAPKPATPDEEAKRDAHQMSSIPEDLSISQERSRSDSSNSMDVGDENENLCSTQIGTLETMPTGYNTYSKPVSGPYSQNAMLTTTQASSQAKNTYLKTATTPFKMTTRPLSRNTDFPNSLSALQKGQIDHQETPLLTEKVRFRSLDLSPSALSKVLPKPNFNAVTLSGYDSPNTFSNFDLKKGQNMKEDKVAEKPVISIFS